MSSQPEKGKAGSEQGSDIGNRLADMMSWEGSDSQSHIGSRPGTGSFGGSQAGSYQPGSKVGGTSHSGSYNAPFTPTSSVSGAAGVSASQTARRQGQNLAFQAMISEKAENQGGSHIFESSPAVFLPPPSARGPGDDLPLPVITPRSPPDVKPTLHQNGASSNGPQPPSMATSKPPRSAGGERRELSSTAQSSGSDRRGDLPEKKEDQRKPDQAKMKTKKSNNALDMAMQKAGGKSKDPKEAAAKAAELGKNFAKQVSKMDFSEEGVGLHGRSSTFFDASQSLNSIMLKMANSRALSIIVFSCVGLNGIQMGFQTDYDGFMIYDVLDNIFTLVFTVEMIIKICAFRSRYFCDGWNVFDFIITTISIVDLWIMKAVGGGGGMKVLAVFRIFRVFRAVRLLRMLKSLRELALIMEGLMHSVGTTSWVCLLLLMLLYIFSILCVRVIGKPGTYEGYSEQPEDLGGKEFNSYQYFGTVPRSMFTLLNLAMLTDDWFVVSRSLLEEQPGILFLFLAFVLFCNFGLLNVIIGITVETVMESARGFDDNEDAMRKRRTLERLETLYEFVFTLDMNKDETIDADELVEAWDRPELQELLSIVNLPVGAEAEELVDLIDSDGDGKLEMEEFVRSLVRLLTNDQYQQILEVKAQLNRVSRNTKLYAEEMATKKEVEGVRNEVKEVKSILRGIHNELVQMRQGRNSSF